MMDFSEDSLSLNPATGQLYTLLTGPQFPNPTPGS